MRWLAFSSAFSPLIDAAFVMSDNLANHIVCDVTPILGTTTLLAWILLDVEALQPNKLLETESAQRDSFAGILPSRPCKILASVSLRITRL